MPTYQTIPFENANLPIDFTLGNDITIGTLTGNLVVGPIINAPVNSSIFLRFQQDLLGNRLVTFPRSFKAASLPSGLAKLRLDASFKFDGLSWVSLTSSGWYGTTSASTNPSVTSTTSNGVSQDVSFIKASLPIDLTKGNILNIGTLTGNLQVAVPTGAIRSNEYTYIFTQDATGGREVTFPDGISFGSGSPGKKLVLTFLFDGTDYIQKSPSYWS